jgi:TP901 family phage tail tape measure protein
MGVIANLVVRIAADVQPLDSDLRQLGKRFDAVGKDLKTVGVGLTAAITAPLVGLAAFAGKVASDFDSAFANVRKTVDATAGELDTLKQGIRDLAKDIPVAADELANIAALGGQFGVSTAGLLGFTETVARLGVALDGISTDEAAEALAQIANITNTSEAEFSNLASTLVDLGNKGASSEATILDLAKRLSAAGTQAGLSAADVFGLGAALANLGVEAESGGTALSKTLRNISKAVSTGGADLANFAKVAGMTSDQFATMFREGRATEAITAVLEGFGRLQQEGVNLTGVFEQLELTDSRQQDALSRLAGAHGEVTTQIKNANQAFRENAALNDESTKKFATFENQLKLVQNKLYDVAITIGEPILRAITVLLDKLDPLFDGLATLAGWFGKLPFPVQAVALAIGAVAAAVGPALILIGQMSIGLGAIFKGSTAAAGGLGLATFASKALATALAVITSPITGIVAGVAALVLGLRYFTGSWEGVLRVLTLGLVDFKTLATLWDGLTRAGSALGGMLADLGSAIASKVIPILDALGSAIHTVWNSEIVGLIRAVAQIGANVAGWLIVEAGRLAFQYLANEINNAIAAFKLIAGWIGKASDGLKSDLGPTLNAIRGAFLDWLTKPIRDLQAIWEWVNKNTKGLRDFLDVIASATGGAAKTPEIAAPALFQTPKPTGPPPISAEALALANAPIAKGGGGFEGAEDSAKKIKKLLEDAAKTSIEFQNKLTDATLSGTTLRLTQIERERSAELAKFASLGGAADATRAAINAYYNHERDLANGTASTIVQRAQEAGVSTRAELQKTSDDATRLYDQMRASGLFAFADLEEARKKADEAQRRALGINVEAFKATEDGVRSVIDALPKLEQKWMATRQAGEKFESALTASTMTETQRRLTQIDRERRAQLAKWQGVDDASRQTRDAINAFYDHEADLATRTASTIVERMRSAGIQTRDDLRATADTARIEYEQMQASGEFTYIALDEARQVWHNADIAAAETMGASYIDAFAQIAQAFAGLASSIGGRAGDIIGAIGGITGSLSSALAVAKKTGSNWGQLGTVFDSSAKGADRLAAGAQSALAIAQGIGQVAQATDKATAGARALGGALAGAQAGAAFGPYGMAVGAAAGLVVGLVRGKPEWAKAATEIGRDLGVKVSEELSRAIAKESKEIYKGDRSTAIQANLTKILKEAGGITTQNVDKWTAKIRDTFSFISRGQLDKAFGGQQLDETFGQLVEATGGASGLLRKNVKELITLNSQFGTQSTAIAGYVTEQVGRSLGGLTTFLDNAKVSTQSGATAIGGALTAAFAEISKKEGFAAAIQAVAPAMKNLESQMLAAGFAGTTAFDSIRQMVNFVGVETNAKALTAIEGLNQSLIGLENSGLLTQEMFAGLTTEIGATHAAMVAQGADGSQAMLAMQPTLQTLFELQQDFGYELDETTGTLLEQAKAAGVVGDKFRDANDRMATAMEGVADILKRIAEAMGVTLPDDAKKGSEQAADHLRDEFGNLIIPPIRIPYVYVQEGASPSGFSPPDIPALAAGGLVTRPTVALIGEKGPELITPLSSIRHAGGEQTIVINLDGRTIATQTVKHMPRVVRLYGA